MSSEWHLAQFNMSRLVAPEGDARVQPFFDALARVNALADSSPGFVWRLQDEDGDATGIRGGGCRPGTARRWPRRRSG